ncbi:ABC transporter ATP-binding protein [Mucilaginibacter aquatilis]|uniref:ATP-binding cassette domain-containing protein n=1 Tax=Mucilaginibacter aquatilis TaxID=1517760 RepID=A0A6I4IR23_9SPHI|nr:ABC transporter ATP-binding protein [Mucilaginibacter aquatilis]MVN92054.1 ATP-binding cassette domain-containing protein [Mucilaginibacter aquatilis]
MGLNIILTQTGRRFNRDWIFNGIDYTFLEGNSYAVLGPNGSGKSTLLQLLNGSLTPSTGNVKFSFNGSDLHAEDVYQHISMAAPYLELIEDFTLTEVIDFHFKFKPYNNGMNRAGIIDLLGMKQSKHKLVRYFSSGMKQRLKLALAFCSDTAMLMLDEPTSNLDVQGIDWYLQLVMQYAGNRLIIVGSNQLQEYSFCTNQLHITDYKRPANN